MTVEGSSSSSHVSPSDRTMWDRPQLYPQTMIIIRIIVIIIIIVMVIAMMMMMMMMIF